MNINLLVKARKAEIKKQFQKLIPTFAIIYIPTVCILSGLFIMHWKMGINISYAMRDSYTVFSDIIKNIQPKELESFNFPLYIGLVSNLGILLWCSVTAICFFTCTLVTKKLKSNLSYSVFFWSCIISSFLLLVF